MEKQDTGEVWLSDIVSLIRDINIDRRKVKRCALGKQPNADCRNFGEFPMPMLSAWQQFRTVRTGSQHDFDPVGPERLDQVRRR